MKKSKFNSKIFFLFFPFFLLLISCQKEKLSVESLKGNWIFTEFTSVVCDSNGQYISKVVNEGGFLRIDKDSSILNSDQIVLGRAKLPFLYSNNPTSLYYNNGNNFMYEENIYFFKNNIDHKNKGNYRNYFQSAMQFLDVNDPNINSGGNAFEMLQHSKSKITLKLYSVSNVNTVEKFNYSLIELKKQ